jgi:predicted transcriptional regulator
MQSVLEKPSSVNVTVKLEASERDRLKSLAVSKKRTPHYLMKEAISAYLQKEEASERFIQVAKASLVSFNATGKHISLDEFSAWAKEIKKNPKAPLPSCHK